jgi:hypothetical protein
MSILRGALHFALGCFYLISVFMSRLPIKRESALRSKYFSYKGLPTDLITHNFVQ